MSLQPYWPAIALSAWSVGRCAVSIPTFPQRPFNPDLVGRVAVLKAWTDQRKAPLYERENFVAAVLPANYRWEDSRGWSPRHLQADAGAICAGVRACFAFLTECAEDERTVLTDKTSQRHLRLSSQLRDEAAHPSAATLALRRLVHARLAEVVTDTEERAKHLALAAGEADAGVAGALDAAAEHARARGAPGAAAELLELARRLTPTGTPVMPVGGHPRRRVRVRVG